MPPTMGLETDHFYLTDDDLTNLNWLQDGNLLKNVTGSVLNNPKNSINQKREPEAAGGKLPTTQIDARRDLTLVPDQNESKPPFSFSCLIFMAIESSPQKALPVKQIYSWIIDHFPFYRSASEGWKNTVRHNLSLNRCFRKVSSFTDSLSVEKFTDSLPVEKVSSFTDSLPVGKVSSFTDSLPVGKVSSFTDSLPVGKGSLWSVVPSYRQALLNSIRSTSKSSNRHYLPTKAMKRPEFDFAPFQLKLAIDQALVNPKPSYYNREADEAVAAECMLSLKTQIDQNSSVMGNKFFENQKDGTRGTILDHDRKDGTRGTILDRDQKDGTRGTILDHDRKDGTRSTILDHDYTNKLEPLPVDLLSDEDGRRGAEALLNLSMGRKK